MSVLSRITRINIQRNKKRSIVTMLGVALSIALLFIVIAIPCCFWQTLKEFQISEYGNFHQSFENIPGDKLKIIEHAAGVESVYYSSKVEIGDDYSYLKDSSAPYPTALYERMDSLSDEQRSAENEYVVYVRYEGPLRKAGYAKPMHERYGNDIVSALKEAELENINVRTNDSLLAFDGNVDYNTNTILISIATLVIGSIIIASIFTIRNSFNISTTERIREFGILSSIGATPRQIRYSVLLEAIIIGAVAIPVGLILGTILTFALLGVTNSLLNAASSMVFFVPWWAIVIDVVSGFIIILLSSASAAIRAGRLTPIDAIRSTQDVAVNPKKLKTSKFISNYFGVGGIVASKNLKRSKQKYRTTVISIIVSVAAFVGLSGFIADSQRIIDNAFPYKDVNFIVEGGSITDYKELEDSFNLGEHVYYQHALAGRLEVFALSSEYFEKYARSLGITNDFEKAAILNDYVEKSHSNGAISVSRALTNMEGDELSPKVIDYTKDEFDENTIKTFNVTISKVTDKKPLGIDRISNPTIFISENHVNAKELVFSDYTNMLYANPGDQSEDLLRYIETINEHRDANSEVQLYAFDIRGAKKQTSDIMLLVAIFMYGFIAFIALIGLTNIFNTITTNIQLRAKEFAILKSVGMTDDEFNRMIRLESILYSVRALAIGIPIGIAISYGVHYVFDAGGIGLSYELPILPIIISIVAVAALIAVIMNYSVRRVSKQNIIETIRQDTV
ncbi:MAG: ABC transporter permease [Candidatus Saccharibacteria bacterium]|nr:ABC transporter permease [Candidatus Saccharibacteria bacterium]